MRILITCATKVELEPLLNVHHKLSETNVFFNLITTENKHIDVLFSGVGMLSTTFHLTQHLLAHPYDLVLNVGIAGSVQEAVLGKVYQITHEHVYEFGAEDKDDFMPLQAMNFLSKADPLSESFFEVCTDKMEIQPALEKACAITVNKIHGNIKSIALLHSRMKEQNIQGAVLESMEGAAFAYVCRQLKQHAIQVRSVSNIVEERNRENWKMKEAIRSLNDWLFEFLEAEV
jgi:futalosine hydrolase